MQGQRTFLSEVTSRGADMFRAVSLCFLFIHKQRPTVITPSFKYQRAPLRVRSQSWPPVRPHDFSPEQQLPKDRTFPVSKVRDFLFSRFPPSRQDDKIYPSIFSRVEMSNICNIFTQSHRTVDFSEAGSHKVTAHFPLMPCDIRIGFRSD